MTLQKKRRISRYWLFVIIFLTIILCLNGMAKWKKFCDFYTNHLFGIWSETYGRLMGLFPFSVGEILIAVGIIILFVAVICAVLLIFLRKKEGYKRFCIRYFKSLLVILLCVILVMTLNCSMLYNCSKLKVVSEGELQNRSQNTLSSEEKMILVRNYIVEKCNELASLVNRDEKGYITYAKDLNKELPECLRSLSEDYSRLAGYYPKAKPMMASYIMYQAGILGEYFPFSMEANYNKYISDSYKAAVIAHELSHLKGYIYEDEANFIAFMACIKSDDLSVQYSGYLSVLDYIEGDAYTAYCLMNRLDEANIENYFLFSSDIPESEQVLSDNLCYTEETWEELEETEPVIDRDVVESFSNTFTESYLDYYGAEANYDEVTLLLLEYYEGILY